MIKFGQFPFPLKAPQLKKDFLIKVAIGASVLAIVAVSLKLYLDLQSSQANLARMTAQVNDLNKNLSALKSDMLIEKEGAAKNLLDAQSGAEAKVGAFAKQAAACEEVKRKLDM